RGLPGADGRRPRPALRPLAQPVQGGRVRGDRAPSGGGHPRRRGAVERGDRGGRGAVAGGAAVSTARTRTLREIAQLNPRAAQLEPEDEVAFVGMADLDDVSARTTSDTRRPYSEVSKGYTPFRNGDLLAAKITPCWQNGKIGVATLDVEHGVGSTEFHVIRPDDEVNPRYLLHFLRTPEVRETGTLRMTGSGGQRRVPLK